MSYQPLATKYRPSRFEELVGQDTAAKALANAIKLGREPHGVIFSGVRGIGKTTTARLYAKALNCDNGPTPTPCNNCPSCQAITRGSHEDVMEIDGASNTGVGDVRDLQETVEYAPQRSKFKVYIIDEVHMLSQAAFNALLKTLEEPPKHVVFIFATTELAKVPQTIVSRCQTFYLQKLSLLTIRNRLLEILAAEGIEAEDQAVTIVAKEGHGSMRDALTALDQAIAVGEGKVSVDALAGIVSNLSTTPFLDMLDALVARDGKAVYTIIDHWDQDGAEFETITDRLATMARHAFVIRDLGADALDVGLLGLDDEEVTRLAAVAEKAPAFDLNRMFRTLVKSRSDMRGEIMDRFIFENYLLEWCFDPGLPDLQALLQGKIPIAGQSGGARSVPAEQVAPASSAGPAVSSLPDPAATKEKFAGLRAELKAPAPKPIARPVAEAQAVTTAKPVQTEFPATWRELVDTWKAKKPLQARKLEEVRPLEFGPDRLVLSVDPDSFASKSLLTDAERKYIAEEFKKLFGFIGQLEFKPGSKNEYAGATVHDEVPRAANPATPLAPASEPDVPPSAPMPMAPQQSVTPEQTAPVPREAPPRASTPPGLVGATHEPPAEPASPIAPAVPETILETKDRENELRREKIIADAKGAPLTQEVVSVLGGSVKDVKVRESGLHPEA